MTRRVPELPPGEELRATTSASFRGAAAASTRATFAFASQRMRDRAYDAWRDAVAAAGFPTAGPEMIVALTNRRLLVYHTSFWSGRPTTAGGSIDLDRVHTVAIKRHGMVVGLAFALTNGQIVELEAIRGWRIRRFAHAVTAALADL